MAKLTVFFKDKIIHSELFENGIVHIGRDETNDLTIDSLAVAPAHAAIVIRDDGGSTITQLNDDFPLIINGENIKKCNLNNNDMITLGKHNITYHTTDSLNQTQPFESLIDKDIKSLNQEIGVELSIPAASLQVMDGENIGKILSLKKVMTRLGYSGGGVIVISRRKEGYFVSVLANIGNITLNNVLIEDNTVKLNHNDVLVINNTSLQFFQN
jgi:hypothetical protein